MRTDRACLLDILEAIAGIEKYRTTREAFNNDERTQAWMVSRLQIIGEAARHLSRDLRNRHSEIPWRLVVGMRHHLVHPSDAGVDLFDAPKPIKPAAAVGRTPPTP